MGKCSVCNKEFEDKYFDDEEGKCILHCNKDNWGSFFDDSKMRLFTFKIQDIISAEKKNDKKESGTQSCEFNQVIFPSIDDKLSFFGFDDLNNDIELIFNHCTFVGETTFRMINNAASINFQKCFFSEKVIFSDMNFDNNFKFIFESCHLDGCMVFKNIVFDGIVSFIYSEFSKQILFKYVRFNSLALFNETKIYNLHFESSFFQKESNFLNMDVNVETRETARIIKDSFEKQNNIIEANKFYALEMKKREEELNQEGWSEDKFIFMLHRITSEHSQNWFLSLRWILIFSFIYALYNQVVLTTNYWGVLVGLLLISPLIINFSIDFSKKSPREKCLNYINIFLYFLLVLILSLKEFNSQPLIDVINPLSKPINDVTLDMFIFKVIIAYLIYQFIVSVRQNTRRK